jgi:hypothetical protein
MSEIPKRHDYALYVNRGEMHLAPGLLENSMRLWIHCPDHWKALAHEHAVAVRAVEALKEAKCQCIPSAIDPKFSSVCNRCAALRDIDASGWKP